MSTTQNMYLLYHVQGRIDRMIRVVHFNFMKIFYNIFRNVSKKEIEKIQSPLKRKPTNFTSIQFNIKACTISCINRCLLWLICIIDDTVT